MKEPSLHAGRESNRVSASPDFSRQTYPNNVQYDPELEAARVSVLAKLLGGVECRRATNSPHNPETGLFPLEGMRTSTRRGLPP